MHWNAIDLTGHKYGRLKVLRLSRKKMGERIAWRCECECGRIKITTAHDLRGGNTKSCGCLKKDATIASGLKRRKPGSFGDNPKLYKVWTGMKARCNDPKKANYIWYGAKGVKVCQEWSDDFIKFLNWATAAGYKPGLHIDRIDNDRGYSPENCRWATPKENINNRSCSRRITLNGVTMTLQEASDLTGIAYHNIVRRLNQGKTAEEATSPIKKYKPQTR